MRQRKLLNQINVVPYVDVMLVLLVIFMVTAPLVTPGLIELPSVDKSSQAPAAPPLEVVIRRDGALTLRERVTDKGGSRTEERTMTSKELIATIHGRQTRGADQPVVIAADKDVRYEEVLKVMDGLKRANVQRVGLLVKPAGP
jgi:biopolymer transport protein TolR